MKESLGRATYSLRAHPPLLFRVWGQGSVLTQLRIPLLAFSAWATLVWWLYKHGIVCFPAASKLSSTIQLVVGLLVSYRSSSSSDRWHEGRRIWASTTSVSRSLMRTLVLALAPLKPKSADAQAVRETLALIPAFSYAMKYHLRSQERPWNFPELRELLPDGYVRWLDMPYHQGAGGDDDDDPTSDKTHFLQRTDSSEKRRRTTLAKDVAVGAAEAKEAAKAEDLLNLDAPSELIERAEPSHKATDNLPLDILRLILAYLNLFHTHRGATEGAPESEAPQLEAPTWANCIALINTMTEHLSNVERIRDTPIPMALAIHLEQLMTIYLLLVAPQHVNSAGWMVIPITFLATFTFFGIHAIGQQLSDPFGTDHANSLPIDRFCADLRREWAMLVRGRPDLEGPPGQKAWEPSTSGARVQA